MRIINIIDEQGRYNGFKADCSYEPQADSHIVSYLYGREHYYKKFKAEKIGLEIKSPKDIKDNENLERILRKYDLVSGGIE